MLHLKILLLIARYAFILKHKLFNKTGIFTKILDGFLNYTKNYTFKFAEKFKPYHINIEDCDIEIHSLVCKRDLHMYLWSLRALLHFTQVKSLVIAHDDGTLDRSDNEILKRSFPGIKIISRSEGDRIINKLLKKFPSCQQYWRHSIFGLKLFDHNLLSRSPFIFSFDSDILYFKKPTELIKIMKEKTNVVCFTKEFDNHLYKNDTMLGQKFPNIIDGFNSGQVFYPQNIFKLSEVEAITEWLLNNQNKIESRLGEQLILNILSSTRNTKLLSSKYSNYPASKILKDNLVSKHYHSAIKGLFWLEGIRFLLKNKDISKSWL